MEHHWDPGHYLAYADERARPFVELMARVGAESPDRVVDLGCGPGNLTARLAARWPAAQVLGLDSSAEMVAAARARGDAVAYDVADLRDWAHTDAQADVLVSNAALQWVPGHLDLLPALVDRIRPGGWLAVQVPGNFTEPSHVLRQQLAAEEPYARRTAGVASPEAHDATTYLRAMQELECTVDAWETTYLHVLQGADAVFEWISGTSLRPTLAALDELAEPFAAELRRRLRLAYPDDGHGVLLPFRRVFVVARRTV